jgi:hypothetical protein
MAKFSQQLIDEQYKKLPQELKDAIFSVDIADRIFEIGRKFALTIEKNGFLAEETAFIVLGLLKPEEFTATIKNRLGVEDTEAQEISKEVNRQILLPIREALKRAHQIEIKEELGITNKELGVNEPPMATVPAKPVEPVAVKPPLPEVRPVAKPAEPPAVKKEIPETQPNHFLDKKELEDLKAKIRNEVKPVPEQKVVVPLPDGSTPLTTGEKGLELIPPPPSAKPKLQPIDLRQGLKPRPVPPQFMSGTIFVPPSAESRSKNQELRTEKNESVKEESSAEQKVVPKPRGFDPYKEPIE